MFQHHLSLLLSLVFAYAPLARPGDPPGSGGTPQTPMYISNPDFVFAAMYQEPRFAAVSGSCRGKWLSYSTSRCCLRVACPLTG